ncbi:MAG: hypothetical protein OEN23_06780 [Paracoccaceae bacterium]|nr:hypothetical protein [Paracoccaceae bacterium]
MIPAIIWSHRWHRPVDADQTARGAVAFFQAESSWQPVLANFDI